MKFPSKYRALSKISKPCEDQKNSHKDADKIIANKHLNVIDVTQYGIDSNFPKTHVWQSTIWVIA